MNYYEQSFAFLALVTSYATAASHCHRLTYTDDNFGIPFHSMVVFGDSFSDVGNIHYASNETQPGVWSWDGRYSDGRVWHEYVSQFFGLPQLTPSAMNGGTDYAWGGATTDDTNIDAFSSYLNDTVPGVSQQIMTYLEDHHLAEEEVSPGDSLHVLFSGYNDYWWYVYRNYTTSEGQDLNFTNVYTTVANEVVQNVHRLYDAGARYFLVANVMNMSTWAEAEMQPQQVLDAYDVLVSGHNAVLSELLIQFEGMHDDATVYNFDVFDTFECLNERKDYLGIVNVYNPCHPNQTENCGDIFSYKFWDWYHPTTHAHQYASTRAIQSIYDKEEQKTQYQQQSISSSGQYARTSLRMKQ